MGIYSGFGIDLPFKSASDMDAYQYHFVKLDTVMGSPYVNLATGGSNPRPFGVLQNDPLAEGAANVRVAGVSIVRVSSSGALNVGDMVRCGSDGHGEKILATASGCVGLVLQEMTAGCGLISVLLYPWASKVIGTT